ncbi:MAG: class I SAM-dependent methyltransferase [Gemmatimonadota bacterium]|nr:MAG: class I SAM-dependent methyltransferase [Gemmatimonadota bacterium]
MQYQWTPEFWQGWREDDNPYRQRKSARDLQLACQLLDLEHEGSLLEVGCGYGWISQVLLSLKAVHWIGVDRSLAMVKDLRKHLSHYRPRAFVADAYKLPFPDDSFDRVICSGVLMHLRDERAALGELVRVLRPGGRLVVSMNNALSPYCLPAILHNRRKQGYVQQFHLPRTYRRWLRSLGLESHQLQGDGIISTVSISAGPLSWPPRFAFNLLKSLDALAVRHLPWLAYEVWLQATKKVCDGPALM